MVLIRARDPATHVPLSRGESMGLLIETMAGLASTLAATYILILIFVRMHKQGWSSWDALDASITALFASEVIQGISHTMELKWAIAGMSKTGSFCTAQGIIRQLGANCVALATMTIAVQTFLVIWFLKHLNRTISVIVLGVEFTVMVLIVGIGFGVHTHPPKEYYAIPTPYWCWIGREFLGERIGGQYLWFWLALFVSLAVYAPLFLLYLQIIKPGTRWYSPAAESLFLSRSNTRLWSTILYPAVYCVVIMPLSVVRWISFKEEATTGETRHSVKVAMLIGIIIFGLGGVFNAILYGLTRPKIFHAGEKREEPAAPLIRRTSTHSTPVV